MKIINGRVFINGKFENKDIEIKNGLITAICDRASEKNNEVYCNSEGRQDNGANSYNNNDTNSYNNNDSTFDAAGSKILPGFIDIHSHGCVGEDFSDSETEGIHRMLKYYAQNGVTDVLATTMTYTREKIEAAMERCGKIAKENNCLEASLAGIYMEGPFLGRDKKGAHVEKWLAPIDEAWIEELNSISGNSLKVIAIDPTLENALSYIQKKSKDYVISLAHTSVDYDTAMEANHLGANHITHMFNAMNPFLHRAPGLVGAACDGDFFTEMICDGFHLHPSVIRTMFKAIPEKIVLISDSMQAAGLSEGTYALGGKEVFVKDGKATIADGTLAGSIINVHEAVKRCISFGVPEEKAILAATLNPAKSVGIDNWLGSIAVGKKAHLLITDDELNIKKVMIY